MPRRSRGPAACPICPARGSKARRHSSSRQARWVRVSCGSSRSSIAAAPAIRTATWTVVAEQALGNRTGVARPRGRVCRLDLNRAGSPAPGRHRRLRATTEHFGPVHIRHSGPDGSPLVDADVSAADLAAARARWRRNQRGALIVRARHHACCVRGADRRARASAGHARRADRSARQLAASCSARSHRCSRRCERGPDRSRSTSPPSLLVTSLVVAALGGWRSTSSSGAAPAVRVQRRDAKPARVRGHRGAVRRRRPSTVMLWRLRACAVGARLQHVARRAALLAAPAQRRPPRPSRSRSCCSTPRSSGPRSPSSAPPPLPLSRLAPIAPSRCAAMLAGDRRRRSSIADGPSACP